MTAPHWLSAAEIGQAYAAKTLSPVELVTALLARIEALDPKLNAFIRLDAAGAMLAARQAEAEIAAGCFRGALQGVPDRDQGHHRCRWVAHHGSFQDPGRQYRQRRCRRDPEAASDRRSDHGQALDA